MVKSKKYELEKFKLIFENSPIAIMEQDMSALSKLRKQLEDQTVTNIRKYLSEHHDLLKRTFFNIKILDINKAALNLYGAKSRKKLNDHLENTITKHNLDVLVEEFAGLIEGSNIFEIECKIKTVKGSSHDVLLKVSVPEVYKKNFSRVIVTMQDITGRKKLEGHLRRLAQLDSLTKLYNHNTVNQHLETEFLRSKRYGSSFSCMMIDVDHFKVINDQFGHQKGDKVIKQVASTIRKSIRQVDVVGRYGGDEFFVILPETKLIKAKIAASRIQQIFSVKRFNVHKGVSIKVDISIGITGFPSKGIKEPKDIIAKADKAMYMAKKTSRKNTVAL